LKLNHHSFFFAEILSAILFLITPATPLSAQNSPFNGAPESSAHLKNPYSGQQPAVAAGGKLYATNCSSCHGSHGQGNGTMPAVKEGATQSAPDGAVFWFITNGAPDKGMPSWSSLSERQRWQIVSYVKSLGNSHGS
jgi:mono/diheme cytochrome c family protein